VRDRPPWHLWLAPAIVAALRALPFLATRVTVPEPGFSIAPIGYNPKDWLAYVALIRESATTGRLALANPFTTMPQDGRYVLLFQDALGLVVRWTGLDPFVVLELSRIPLLALMFAALWRLTGVVLADRRQRVLACWLVALSGGFEAVVYAAFPAISAQLQTVVNQDLWHLQGWNTFAATYNPLWVAALALTFWTLVPLLRPAGPAGTRDLVTLAVGFTALFWTHPYSAIVVLAVAATRPVLGWMLDVPGGLAGAGRIALALAPVLLVNGAVAAWQSADAVYSATSANALGPQALSPFWYPVTLGAVGFFAARGWSQMVTEHHPARLVLGAWTLAIVFLHSSSVLNGYHFVFQLYPPVCLAAAPALLRTANRQRALPWGAVRVLALAVLLFQSAITLTWKCVGAIATHRVRTDGMQAIALLRDRPLGNVLAPPDLGNYVPAYAPHRVYVGHWFMTPGYAEKTRQAIAALSGQLSPDALAALVDAERIRYLVTTATIAPSLAQQLGGRVEATLPAGQYAVVALRGG